MSTELVIIIVGAVLILLAIGDSLKSNDSTSDLINAKLRIPLGIIGVLLIIYVGYSYGAVNLQGQIEQVEVGNRLEIQYPVETVQVLSPIEGDSVDCRILTLGVYPNDHDEDIWVLLKPSDDKFYPQSDHTNTSYKRNGEWQVITRFGGDKGESFDLLIFETNQTASQYFSTTIEDWKEANLYTGLMADELPEGAVEVSSLTVYTKDNCRGVF